MTAAYISMARMLIILITTAALMLPTRRRQAPYEGDKCDLENSQVATHALHASPDLQEEAQSGRPGSHACHARHACRATCIPTVT